jgi:hypothetical protein
VPLEGLADPAGLALARLVQVALEQSSSRASGGSKAPGA